MSIKTMSEVQLSRRLLVLHHLGFQERLPHIREIFPGYLMKLLTSFVKGTKSMKSVYKRKLSPTRIAIADVTPLDPSLLEDVEDAEFEVPLFLIARINVPVEFRGNGYGTELLSEIVEDADADEVALILEIVPYGDMTYDQLEDWYGRYGFEPLKECGLFVRRPE